MTAPDYLVLVVYLCVVLGIGLCFRTRSGEGAEFFLAGRSMGWLSIGLSVMVTVFSAINYLAFPNEVFGNGLYVIAALPVFLLAAWPITRIWMPFFHSMQLTSVYEYLQRRFDARVRSLASGLFILWRAAWMAVALYASGSILAALAGLPPLAVILVGGLAATAYTSVGGMRAVMWTDVAQFCVLFGGIALGLGFAVGDGGIAEVLELAREGGRLKPFVPFDPDFLSPSPFVRMTLWSGLIGVFVAFLSRYGADQVVMQRYFSAKNLLAAQRGLWLNAWVSVLSLSLLALFGLAVYAHAIKTGAIADVDWAALSPMQQKATAMKQLAGLVRSFPPGVTGLVAAGLLAATMSSIDSGINACSAAYLTDFHRRWFTTTKTEARSSAWLDRALTVAFGILATGLALTLIPLVGKTDTLFMIVNKIINGLGAPLLVLFLLGMFTRTANAPGMLYGGIIGLVASLAISLRVRGLSLQYYAVANLLAMLLPCVVASLGARAIGHVQPADREGWMWFAWRDGEAREQVNDP